MDLTVEADIIQDSLPGKQQIILRHISKMLRQSGNRLLIHRNPSGLSLDDSGQKLQDCGLSTAGRSQQADKFSFFNRKIQIFKQFLIII